MATWRVALVCAVGFGMGCGRASSPAPAEGLPPETPPERAEATIPAAWAAPYRLVSLSESGSILDMSRNGLVLFSEDDELRFRYWVHDTTTGVRREVPASSRIDSSGVTAGIRGTGATAEDGRCHGREVVLYAPDGTTTSLGAPVEGPAGFSCSVDSFPAVTALGDDGTVVAVWRIVEDGVSQTATYSWSGSGWTRLPGAGPSAEASATAGGRTVGYGPGSTSSPGSLAQHALLWQSGGLVDLGLGTAHDVSEGGVVVGACPSGVSWHACAWGPDGATDLGALPGYEGSIAYGINATGEIAGASYFYGWLEEPGWRAVLFAGGRVIDLNDLVDAHAPVLAAALGVSDGGVVAVQTLGPAVPAVLVPTGAPLVADRSWRENGSVLAAGELVLGLAVDADDVYWTTNDGRRGVQLKAVSKRGGTVSTLWRSVGGRTAGTIAVDDEHVWFDLTVCGESCGRPGVWRVAKRGGTPERIGDGSDDRQRLALSDGRVYWARRPPFQPFDEIVSVPAAGGPETIHAAAALSSELAVRDGVVYYAREAWTNGTSGSWRYAYLYAAAGGLSALLAGPTNDFNGGALAVDDGFVYVSGVAGILRIPRSGGASEVVAAGRRARDLHVAGTFVYFVQAAEQGEPGCIGRVPAGGGAPACLDSGPFRYRSVVADDSGVYFVRDAEIIRLPNGS